MSQVLASPRPDMPPSLAARLWRDPDSRSTTIGVLGVVLVHALLYLVGPHLMRLEHGASVLRPHASSREFNIEIAPETFVRPAEKTPEPTRFVETNPDAPENIPDRTTQFGAQNQQVAQEVPTPNGKSERPALEGRKDFESTQIVSGQLRKPWEEAPVPVAPAPMPMEAAPETPRAQQNPLPGFDKSDGANPNTFGTNIAEASPNARPVPERVEGEPDVPLIAGATGVNPMVDPKRPRPRPTIVKQQQVRPAILAENKIGTANIGAIAINAKFNDYGAYLQRLCEAVQLEWEKILDSSRLFPPPGTWVRVRFVLNSQGRISEFKEVENHSSQVGESACTSAITNRAPYGEWTEDMKAALNPNGEELIFTFRYE